MKKIKQIGIGYLLLTLLIAQPATQAINLPTFSNLTTEGSNLIKNYLTVDTCIKASALAAVGIFFTALCINLYRSNKKSNISSHNNTMTQAPIATNLENTTIEPNDENKQVDIETLLVSVFKHANYREKIKTKIKGYNLFELLPQLQADIYLYNSTFQDITDPEERKKNWDFALVRNSIITKCTQIFNNL